MRRQADIHGDNLGSEFEQTPHTLREMEKEMIAKTMTATDAKIVQTAREFGISRATLYRKLREFGFQKL